MNTKTLTKVSIMIVLVFLGTYLFKVPVAAGYCHLGDGIILLGVVILGSRKGAVAGGVGAALADLLGGYAVWMVPTFLIKAIMALIMGLFIEKLLPDKKWNWLIGAITGGVFQIVGYTFAESLLYGMKTAIVDIPGEIIQTGVGIVLVTVFVCVLQSSGLINRIKEM